MVVNQTKHIDMLLTLQTCSFIRWVTLESVQQANLCTCIQVCILTGDSKSVLRAIE